MSNLIELSKELKVRAEVLRDRLAMTGREPPALDEELDEDDTLLLVAEFGGPTRTGPRGSFPVPERMETLEPQEVPQTGPLPADSPIDPLAELPSHGSDLPPDLDLPAPMEALEASDSLLDSLDDLERVGVSLTDLESTPEPEAVEEWAPAEEVPPALEEALPESEELPEFAPLASAEKDLAPDLVAPEETQFVSPLTSEELQARLDELAGDLSFDASSAGGVKESAFKKGILAITGFFGALSLKEKFLIAGAGAAAAAIFGTGIYVNRVNYGVGGDERFYRQGLALQKDGDLDSAADRFRKVLSRYPGSLFMDDSEFGLAEIARAREDFTEADRRMRAGIRAQAATLGNASSEWTLEEIDKRWKGLFFLGEVNTLREDWDASVDWFAQLIEEATGTSFANRSLYQLANALYNRGKPETAESWELRETVEAYETALSASPEAKEGIPARLRLAETWERFAERERGFSEKRIERALQYYEDLRLRKQELEAAGVDPIDISLAVGRLYRELGRIEDSIRLYQALIEAPRDKFEEGPLPHKVNFGLARGLLERAGRYGEEDPKSASAEADLTWTLELLRSRVDQPFSEEEMTEVVYLRGHAYYQLGALQRERTGEIQNPYFLKMEIAYQSGLARDDRFGEDGDDSLLASMRRTNYLFAVNRDYSEAARSYEGILEKFPNSRYAYLARYRLAEAYFALEDYAKAESEYSQVVDTFSNFRYTSRKAFRDSYFKLGYCQFLLENFSAAARTYKSLLSLLDYENSEEGLKAWKRLGWSYYQQGLYDEAAEEYRAFLARYPEKDSDGSVRVSLGRTLLQRFDYDQARVEFERVIRDHPGSEMARWSRYLVCESYLTQAATLDKARRRPLLNEALSHAEAIRNQYPDEDRVLAVLGRLYFELGDYKRAVRELEYYKFSTRNSKPSSDNQLRLAEAYYRLEDYSNAILNFEQIDLSSLSRDEAARALYLQGESQRLGQRLLESIETYNQMIEQYPTSPLKELAEGRVEEVTWNLSKGLGTAKP